MKYMGSKRRIANDILAIILKDIQPNQYYIEPFVGGCNMIDKVNHNLKIGADNNQYLIAMWKELQNGWTPPLQVTKEEYEAVKADYKALGSKYPDYLKGYYGFNCAFRSIWFTGYAKADEKNDYVGRAFRNVTKQVPNILDVDFYSGSYDTLEIPDNSIIYCDPPYANTAKYSKDGFNSSEFWEWCRIKVNEGHKIFISEYNAPDDFVCIWSKNIKNQLSTNREDKAEKLFVHKTQF